MQVTCKDTYVFESRIYMPPQGSFTGFCACIHALHSACILVSVHTTFMHHTSRDVADQSL